MTPPPLDPASAKPAPRSDTALRGRRRCGKVARLPKALRDKINCLLADGKTYSDIITELESSQPALPHSISTHNLSEWKKRGYQDWLVEQRWIEETRTRQEISADLVRDNDPADLHQAALQLGTLHIFEALRALGPDGFNQKLGGDPAAFARLINALARATRESLLLQKYRQACAQARALLQPLKDPSRKLDESEHRAVVRKINEILGLRSEYDYSRNSRGDEAPFDFPSTSPPVTPNHPNPRGSRGDEAPIDFPSTSPPVTPNLPAPVAPTPVTAEVTRL